MKETLETFLLAINVLSVVFFFGFHFSQFRTLVKDVGVIRSAVEGVDSKVDKAAIDIAHLTGRIERMNGHQPH